jgi:hypothetical protein
MAKFVVYEKVSETIYKNFVDKATASGGMNTTVNLGSGLIAGFAAAIISQPADTMLSKINKTQGLPGEGTTSRLVKIAKELGLRGSYAGIGARLFMVGTLVCLLLRLIHMEYKANVINRLPDNSLSTVISRRPSAQPEVLRSPQSRRNSIHDNSRSALDVNTSLSSWFFLYGTLASSSSLRMIGIRGFTSPPYRTEYAWDLGNGANVLYAILALAARVFACVWL